MLEVISRSAFDLQAVFDAVVESSARLCTAERAFFFRLDGELLRTTATYNVSAEVDGWFERNPIRVDDGKSIIGRSPLSGERSMSLTCSPTQNYKYPAKAVETYRSFLAVPVLRGNDLLGVISLYHPEVKPFTDRQVAVVETFAHQAAIAIENTRLFEAEQQRSKRADRIAGATDRDRGSAARHFKLAGRSAASFRGDAGECSSHLRCELRLHVSFRGRAFAARGHA